MSSSSLLGTNCYFWPYMVVKGPSWVALGPGCKVTWHINQVISPPSAQLRDCIQVTSHMSNRVTWPGYHIWTITIYGTSILGHAPFGKLTLLGPLTIYGNAIFGSRPYMVAASFGQVYIIHSSFVTGPNHIRVVPLWTVSTGLSMSIIIPYTLSVNLPDFPRLGKFISPLVG